MKTHTFTYTFILSVQEGNSDQSDCSFHLFHTTSFIESTQWWNRQTVHSFAQCTQASRHISLTYIHIHKRTQLHLHVVHTYIRTLERMHTQANVHSFYLSRALVRPVLVFRIRFCPLADRSIRLSVTIMPNTMTMRLTKIAINTSVCVRKHIQTLFSFCVCFCFVFVVVVQLLLLFCSFLLLLLYFARFVHQHCDDVHMSQSVHVSLYACVIHCLCVFVYSVWPFIYCEIRVWARFKANFINVHTFKQATTHG